MGDVRGAGLMIGVEFVKPHTTQHSSDIATKVQAANAALIGGSGNNLLWH